MVLYLSLVGSNRRREFRIEGGGVAEPTVHEYITIKINNHAIDSLSS